MKEENVKIIQITVEPYKYYVSNGSAYKDTYESHKIFGLGDDNKVYKWGEHYVDDKQTIGWKLYIPS